jgi:hypothetical protein
MILKKLNILSLSLLLKIKKKHLKLIIMNTQKILGYLGFIATGVLVVVGSIYAVRMIDKKMGTSVPSKDVTAPVTK